MYASPPGALVISLDFELYWGLFDTGSLEDYRHRLLGARDAIPRLLDLFEEYSVAATWATVGFLMCESREELFEVMPRELPTYDDPRISSYGLLEKIGADEEDDPFHFAPSLVEEIRRRPDQEIGTHTFSHYYCLDPGQSAEAFAADLDAALRIGRRRGIEIKSAVFPRNQINRDYMRICREQDIVAVRGNPLTPWHRGADFRRYNSFFHRAGRLLDAYLPLNGPRHIYPELFLGAPPTNIPATRYFRPYSRPLAILEPRRRWLVKDELTTAAHLGGLCHLWWHPHNFGIDTMRNLEILRGILDHFTILREAYGMESHNMSSLAKGQKASHRA